MSLTYDYLMCGFAVQWYVSGFVYFDGGLPHQRITFKPIRPIYKGTHLSMVMLPVQQKWLELAGLEVIDYDKDFRKGMYLQSQKIDAQQI